MQGLSTRLVKTHGKIPEEEAFSKAADHVLKLSSDMRIAVLSARCVMASLGEERSSLGIDRACWCCVETRAVCHAGISKPAHDPERQHDPEQMPRE